MKKNNEWLMTKVLERLPKDVPQSALDDVYISTSYASERLDGVSYWVEFSNDYATADGCHTVHVENLTDLKKDLQGVHYVGVPDEPKADAVPDNIFVLDYNARHDEPTAQPTDEPTAQPQKDEPQTDVRPLRPDFVTCGHCDGMDADGVKYTDTTDVKPSKDANKKKEYKPIEDDGTAYARVIKAFVCVYRAMRSQKPRWDNITPNSPCFTRALYALANVIVSAVLKKIYDASANETIMSYRRERDLQSLDAVQYCIEHGTDTVYTKTGKKKTVITNRDEYDAIHEILNNGMSERMNMIQHTAEYIIEYCSRISNTDIFRDCVYTTPDGKKHAVNFLTRPMKYRHVNKRIYITDTLATDSTKNTFDSVRMVTDDTTLLQLLHKKVREYIDANDSKTGLSRKYVYISREITTPDGKTIELYERGIAYTPFTLDTAHDIDTMTYTRPDGLKKTAYKGNAERLSDIIKDMGLTEIQADVLKYRLMDGGRYGYKAIATATRYSLNSVKSALREIRNKAKKIGLCPDLLADNVSTDTTPIDTHNTDTAIRCKSDTINTLEMNFCALLFPVCVVPSDYGRVENGRKYTTPSRLTDDDKTPFIRANIRRIYDMTQHDDVTPQYAFKTNLIFKPQSIDMVCDLENPTAKTDTPSKRPTAKTGVCITADGVTVASKRQSKTRKTKWTCNTLNVSNMSADDKHSFFEYFNTANAPQKDEPKKDIQPTAQPTTEIHDRTKYTTAYNADRRHAVHPQTDARPYTLTTDADGVTRVKYTVISMHDAVKAYMSQHTAK